MPFLCIQMDEVVTISDYKTIAQTSLVLLIITNPKGILRIMWKENSMSLGNQSETLRTMDNQLMSELWGVVGNLSPETV